MAERLELAPIETETDAPGSADAIARQLDAMIAQTTPAAAAAPAPPLPSSQSTSAPAATSRRRRRRGTGGRKLTKADLERELRAARGELAQRNTAEAPHSDAGEASPAVVETTTSAPETDSPATLPPVDPERARKHAAHLTRALSFTGNLLASARGDHMRLEAHEEEALNASAADSLPAIEQRVPGLAQALDWLPCALLVIVIAAIVDRRLQAELAIRRGERAREFTPQAAALPATPAPA